MDPERVFSETDPLYEVEEDNDRDLAEEASMKYDLLNVLNSIGTDDFENVYLMCRDSIKGFPLELQQDFCNELLQKIREVYNFEFLVKLELSEIMILDLYKFIEFLEYDYIGFLTKLWRMLEPNLRGLNIESFCETNSDALIKEIDEIIETTSFPTLVFVFLKMYSKDDIIKFVTEKTIKSRMLVLLAIQEENVTNENIL